MDIQIDKNTLSTEQIVSLCELDNQLKAVILKLCSTENGRNLQVEYATILTKGTSEDTFKINHNASFDLRHSYVIVDSVSTILKRYFMKNAFDNAVLKVSLQFSRKRNNTETTAEDDANNDVNLTFRPIEPRYSFDKIILPQNVYEDLLNAVKIIEYKDLIYDTWGYGEIEPFARCVINMYGPAGTGKTMCAHAIAHSVGKRLLALNYSEIESKYLGEAAKNLSAAFNLAKKTDSVLFFDEADSFLGKRVQNVAQSSDQALNSLRSQMLILLEEFDGVVIFATNLVSNFDEAFMSRIQKHIKFELPDAAQRSEIVKKLIPSRIPLSHTFTEQDFIDIGKCGEGLSGREIKNAIFELMLSKASGNENIVFHPQDFAQALHLKLEKNKQIEEEKNRIIKERIMRKMAEKVQELKYEKEQENKIASE